VTYSFTIVQKPSYLHVTVTGPNDKQVVERYLAELHRECVARNCFRVLVEERLEGPRLGTLDVYDLVAAGSARARGLFQAIAYVDVNASGELMKFAENVAVNRSLPLSVFRTVADAEAWLQKG
jgi:hypothetical protein